MIIRAFHLPLEPAEDGLGAIAEHEGVRALGPMLSLQQIDDICDALATAQRQLVALSTARIIRGIAAAARRLQQADEPARTEVLAALSALSGYSPPMAEQVLDRIAQDWSESALEQLVAAEFGSADALDGFSSSSDGRRTRAVAPALGLHVFSGNVAGVSVTSIVRALLVRSAVFGKTAAAEPVLAPAFARLLADEDPVLGACVAVTYWPGGDELLEAAVLRRVGMVVHYGAAAGIAALRARAPAHVRMIEHGPRISFAVVHAQRLSDVERTASAGALALAVALFDQQGCVSPQLAYVIGTRADAADFAARVAAALRALEPQLPRGRLSAAEASAIHSLRAGAEFRELSGSDVQTWVGENLTFTVIFTAEPAFEATCLNRTLYVKHAASADDVVAHVRPFDGLLQTVGISGFDEPERTALAMMLAAAGVTRITSLEAMPWPPPSWHHDGRGPLRELVRLVDLEK